MWWYLYRASPSPAGSPGVSAGRLQRGDSRRSHAAGSQDFVHLAGPATASGLFAEFTRDHLRYRAEARGGNLKPLVLDGAWQFKPAPACISVPCARVQTAERNRPDGDWASADFDDSGWPDAWLSEEQTSIRQWQLIGPFLNPDDDGFAAAYPPEKEFDSGGKYRGADGEVGWHTYDSNELHLALGNWNIDMSNEGGRCSGDGYIVDMNAGLQTRGQNWVVSYAHTWLSSPTARRARFIVAADNWSVVWLNRTQVFAQLRTPFWYELNDHWADRMDVDLQQGWNEVLVKVGNARGTSSGYYGFTFRVTDDRENPMTDLAVSVTQASGKPWQKAEERATWYRLEVPPGCIAVVPPALRGPYRMFYDGRQIAVQGSTSVSLPPARGQRRNVLVIATNSGEPLIHPIQFVTGPTPFTLGSWMQTGLPNYSGTAVYTKSFTLPNSFLGRRVILDLGRVSSVAEVSVNGRPAGTLVWDPFSWTSRLYCTRAKIV